MRLERMLPALLAMSLVLMPACASCGEPPRMKPHLTVTDGEVRYEGKVLPLGQPLEAWTAVLGRGRAYGFGGYAWDELGLASATHPIPNSGGRRYMSSLSVYFRHDRDEEGPKQLFRGTLLLNGRRIHADMQDFELWRPCRFQRGRPFSTAYSCDILTHLYAMWVTEDGQLASFTVQSTSFEPPQVPRKK